MKKLKLSFIGKIPILCLLLIVCIIFLALYKNNNHLYVIEQTELYDLKIDYLLTDIKDLDKQNVKIIDKEKEEFIKTVESSKEYIDYQYDFIVNGQNKKYNNIYYTHIISLKYTGGAHYERSDYTFIYDNNEKKFLTIDDFISIDNFKEFIKLVRRLLYKYGEENNISFDKDWLEEGTSESLDNYCHFYIDKQGMTINFVPYQVASWSDGEIKIVIPWNDLYSLVNKKFILEDKELIPTYYHKRALIKYEK